MARKRAVIDLSPYPGLYVSEPYRRISVHTSEDLIRGIARRVRGLVRVADLNVEQIAKEVNVSIEKIRGVLNVREPEPFCTSFMVKLHEMISNRDTYSLLDTWVGHAHSLDLVSLMLTNTRKEDLHRLLNFITVIGDSSELLHPEDLIFTPQVDWRDYLDSGRDVEVAGQVVAARIKAVRQTMGVSRARLADMIHVSKSTIQKIEEYERRCPFYLLTIIAHALGIPRQAFWSAEPFNSHLVYCLKMYQQTDDVGRSSIRLAVQMVTAAARGREFRVTVEVKDRRSGDYEVMRIEDYQGVV